MNKSFYFFPIFLVFYLLIAVSGRAFYEKREIFPAFAWSLYSKIPAHKIRYAIYVTELESKKVVDPLNLFDHLSLSRQAGFNLRRIMIRFKKAHSEKNSDEQQAIIEEIKKTILHPHITEFKIGVEEYFSLERFLNKKVISKKFITKDIDTVSHYIFLVIFLLSQNRDF
jgi:hypothetical protein